jgi:hypothetical protein
MPLLFSYTIPIDDGAVPNPFCGMCSLAICKPAIRRVAKQGDWVAGLGSRMPPAAISVPTWCTPCALRRCSHYGVHGPDNVETDLGGENVLIYREISFTSGAAPSGCHPFCYPFATKRRGIGAIQTRRTSQIS